MAGREVVVLVVDDEEIQREAMGAALADGGYKAIVAVSDEDAEKVIAELGETLGGLVTDINLGASERTGWDIAKRAREANPSLPVVYVTGASASEWPSHGVPQSVLLKKPYTSADLVVALAELRKTS